MPTNLKTSVKFCGFDIKINILLRALCTQLRILLNLRMQIRKKQLTLRKKFNKHFKEYVRQLCAGVSFQV
jgi:hypothetical protein